MEDEAEVRCLGGDIGVATTTNPAQIKNVSIGLRTQRRAHFIMSCRRYSRISASITNLITALFWYSGRVKYSEKPPPENLAANSGLPMPAEAVPPTLVTQGPAKPQRSGERLVPVVV